MEFGVLNIYICTWIEHHWTLWEWNVPRKLDKMIYDAANSPQYITLEKKAAFWPIFFGLCPNHLYFFLKNVFIIPYIYHGVPQECLFFPLNLSGPKH
jgi:hypothetical protein